MSYPDPKIAAVIRQAAERHGIESYYLGWKARGPAPRWLWVFSVAGLIAEIALTAWLFGA